METYTGLNKNTFLIGAEFFVEVGIDFHFDIKWKIAVPKRNVANFLFRLFVTKITK